MSKTLNSSAFEKKLLIHFADLQQPAKVKLRFVILKRLWKFLSLLQTEAFGSLLLVLQLSLLNMSCCESRRIQGPPSHHAIWSVTCKGDIFVSEPSPELEAGPQLAPCDQM